MPKSWTGGRPEPWSQPGGSGINPAMAGTQIQQGQGGTPPPAGTPGVQGGTWTNNVQADPYLSENVDWIRERRGISNVQGQKQRAYGDIDQMASARGKSIEAA